MKARTQKIPTAILNVTIDQFRPIGGVFPITATVKLASPVPGISVVNGDVIVKTNTPVNLLYQIASPDHIFIGAAFDANTPDVDVGTDEFPLVTINRNANVKTPSSSLCVYDANLPEDRNKNYSYVLLVQATTTGEIGVIDPIIRNDLVP